MRHHLITDLTECSEFRQALRARAPKVVHGTALLLVFLLAGALSWMALTKANLVVRATGRVRPLAGPGDFCDHFSEEISSEVGGRVVEVSVDESDQVRQGDILLRLDATRVENQIAKLKRTIQSGKEELEKLCHFEQLLTRQYDSAKAKAEAELAEAEEKLSLARDHQAAEIRLAELELAQAEDKQTRTRKLATCQAASQEQLVEAVTRAREAQEKLRKVQLPLDQGELDVLRRAVQATGREYEVRRKEVEIKRHAKLGEIEAARLELANLELDRGQAVVRAPTDGIITVVKAKVGDIVEPGRLGITMARQKGFQFELFVSNSDVAHLRAGLPTRIKLDAYDYQQYGVLNGKLAMVAPDSEVLEGPGGTQPTMYRVTVTLSQDEIGRGEHRGRVKLGMTGQAEIVTGSESILVLLLKKIRQSISLC